MRGMNFWRESFARSFHTVSACSGRRFAPLLMPDVTRTSAGPSDVVPTREAHIIAPLIRISKCAAAGLSLVLVTANARAAAAQTRGAPSREAVAAMSTLLDSIAEAHRKHQSLPGLSIALTTTSGTVLYTRGYGYADVASSQPVTSATRFRIYSISKVYAATLAHHLAQAGLLSLDAPVGRYLPDLPSWRDSITVRQLLAHTSGIEDYTDVAGFQEALNAGRSEDDRFVALALQQPLHFAPGSRWRYSNTGYVLVQRIIERLAGASFAQALGARILAPGSLHATSARCDTSQVATGYTWAWRAGLKGDSLVVSKARNAYQYNLASGGLCSTALDVAQFFSLLLGRRLVDSASLADMARPVPSTVAQSGTGLFVREDAEGLILEHSGGGGNGNSEVMAFPRDSLVLAAIANTGGAELEELLRTLRRRVLQITDPVVADLPVPPEEVARLLGEYTAIDRPGRVVVYEQGGRLFALGGRLLKQPDGAFVPGLSRSLRLAFRYENGIATEIIVSKYGLVEWRSRRRR